MAHGALPAGPYLDFQMPDASSSSSSPSKAYRWARLCFAKNFDRSEDGSYIYSVRCAHKLRRPFAGSYLMPGVAP
jgi:hypothetical protein